MGGGGKIKSFALKWKEIAIVFASDISRKQKQYFYENTRSSAAAYPTLNNPPFSSSALRPSCWRLRWLGLRPGSQVFLHLWVAWYWSLWLPAARVSDQAHVRGDHAGRQVHCRLCAAEHLLKELNCQDPCQLHFSIPAPSLSNCSAISSPYPWIRAPPAMFSHCAWQNLKMSANNKINDPSPHAESIFQRIW